MERLQRTEDFARHLCQRYRKIMETGRGEWVMKEILNTIEKQEFELTWWTAKLEEFEELGRTDYAVRDALDYEIAWRIYNWFRLEVCGKAFIEGWEAARKGEPPPTVPDGVPIAVVTEFMDGWNSYHKSLGHEQEEVALACHRSPLLAAATT